EDIPLLANHFLHHYRSESRLALRGFDRKTLRTLCQYSWPGNVRQLRNVILSACIVAEEELIRECDLPELESPKYRESLPDWMFESTMEDIERRVILENLNRANGNKTAVAEVLGVTTRTLSNKIRLYRQRGLISLQVT
ncbi:MAG: helix-turn-helix domain-containing protein, partial [Pirellulaceae bacterium]